MEQQKREGKTMLNANAIIKSLKFTATEAEEQKDLFTPSHVLYKCRIINPANNRRYTFNYQCNPTAADELTSKMKSFSYALYYFAEYEKKIASKQYASIDRIKADIERIKEKINHCITGGK